MTCQDCGHRPSQRMQVFPFRDCGCRCHDAADAGPTLLAACKELKDALAAALRVLVKHHATSDFIAEMHAAGIEDGIGIRANVAIDTAEGRS